MPPGTSTSSRSQTSRFATLCVTTMTVRPSRARPDIISITDMSRPGSRPEVGSSRNSSEGFVSSSRATLTRFCWPPDRDGRAGVGVLRQRQLAEHLGDPALPLRLAGVTREPEFGGVAQRAVRGQLRVQDVLLRHQADPVPQFGVVGVQVAPVVEHRARGRRPHPGQRAEQRRLAGAAGPDHPQQAPLAEREADVVQQHLAAGQPDGQAAGVERDVTGVDELLQLVADQTEAGRRRCR